jgi:hypothetical protein
METIKTVENQRDIKDDILYRATRLMYYNELLIKQCDSWLSAEEGNANMMKQIMERREAERIEKRNRTLMRWTKWARFFLPQGMQRNT